MLIQIYIYQAYTELKMMLLIDISNLFSALSYTKMQTMPTLCISILAACMYSVLKRIDLVVDPVEDNEVLPHHTPVK